MKTREDKLAYLKQWRAEKKLSDPDYWKRNYQNHKPKYIDRSCKHSKDNRNEVREYYREYYKDPEKKQTNLESNRKWRKTGHGRAYKRMEHFYRKEAANRPISKLHREEINKIYADCPEELQVDHIHPLISDLVCGLHVPNNLQYLTAPENATKSNKFETYWVWY